MNKDGFTLVELLASITIIAIISSIAAISYSSFIHEGNNRVYKSYEDTMHAEASMYYLENPSNLPSNNTTVRLGLSEMNIQRINNPKNASDTCPNSYVEVTRQDKNSMVSLSYKVCLICNDYNASGDNCKNYVN